MHPNFLKPLQGIPRDYEVSLGRLEGTDTGRQAFLIKLPEGETTVRWLDINKGLKEGFNKAEYKYDAQEVVNRYNQQVDARNTRTMELNRIAMEKNATLPASERLPIRDLEKHAQVGERQPFFEPTIIKGVQGKEPLISDNKPSSKFIPYQRYTVTGMDFNSAYLSLDHGKTLISINSPEATKYFSKDVQARMQNYGGIWQVSSFGTKDIVTNTNLNGFVWTRPQIEIAGRNLGTQETIVSKMDVATYNAMKAHPDTLSTVTGLGVNLAGARITQNGQILGPGLHDGNSVTVGGKSAMLPQRLLRHPQIFCYPHQRPHLQKGSNI
jgi:hypothetical protein